MPGELRRLPSDFVMPEVPVGVEWRAGETARHVRTLVHRWLQRMTEDELRAGRRSGLRRLDLGLRMSCSGAACNRAISELRPGLSQMRWQVRSRMIGEGGY